MKKLFESKWIFVALATAVFVFSELGILWIDSVNNTFAISNFGTFILSAIYFSVVLRRFGIRSLGLALALSYIFLTLLVTIFVFNYHGEQSEWFWIYLFGLGFPATVLGGILNNSVNSTGSVIVTGLIFMVFGGGEYFLVGSYLQLVMDKIRTGSNENSLK